MGSRYGGLKQLDPMGPVRRNAPGLLRVRRVARRIRAGGVRDPARFSGPVPRGGRPEVRGTARRSATFSRNWTNCRAASCGPRPGRNPGARGTRSGARADEVRTPVCCHQRRRFLRGRERTARSPDFFAERTQRRDRQRRPRRNSPWSATSSTAPCPNTGRSRAASARSMAKGTAAKGRGMHRHRTFVSRQRDPQPPAGWFVRGVHRCRDGVDEFLGVSRPPCSRCWKPGSNAFCARTSTIRRWNITSPSPSPKRLPPAPRGCCVLPTDADVVRRDVP